MLKKILLVVFLLLVVLAAGFFLYLQSLKPTYSGNLDTAAVEEPVEIYYDTYGIPHIYANNEPDAYAALGYVHAQDRLWQMEVVRRIAPGRLSELFGTALIKTDQFFRTLSIDQYSQEAADQFENSPNEGMKAAARAYLRGINDFVENGPTPLEFTILGVEKSSFTVKDLYNTVGYMSFSFAAAQRTDPVLTKILRELGPEYLGDLDVHIEPSTTTMKSFPSEAATDNIALHAADVMNNLPVPPWIGSNSWVVGPEKTTSGKVILANDPHIAYSQPAVWYEAHLNAPGFELYGYHLAGYPFANIGHNSAAAFGLTMFENDDIDMFSEKVNPENEDQYWAIDHWENFDTRQEEIVVKDSLNVRFTVRTTRHGPVVNDVLSSLASNEPVSLWWVYTQLPCQLMEATYILGHTEDIDMARKAAEMIHAPGLNVMYGDAQGNIGWWAVARLVKRPEHVNSKLILDGASGNDDPLGYYDFKDNPQAENPPWGYVYSANNQTDTINGNYHPGYYVPEDRARRIVQLLEQDKKWDIDGMKEMILDVQSNNAREIAQNLVTAIESRKTPTLNKQADMALDLLRRWDGNFSLESQAPVIYNKLLYGILEHAFLERLGDEIFRDFISTHVTKRSIQPLIANDSSVWWDDPTTPDVREYGAEVFRRALLNGVEQLEAQLGGGINQWQWSRVHTLEHGHPLGTVEALRGYFNVGPFPVPGSFEVINNYLFKLNKEGEYKVTAGPSTRRLIDFSDVRGNSWSILPTGQSGNPLSPHYKDQAEMYAKGEFRKQLMSEEDIKQTSNNVLTLNPTR